MKRKQLEQWRVRLKDMRLSAGYSQKDLARATRLTQAYISYLESGKRSFCQKTLDPILTALGSSYADLFCGCCQPRQSYRDYLRLVG